MLTRARHPKTEYKSILRIMIGDSSSIAKLERQNYDGKVEHAALYVK